MNDLTTVSTSSSGSTSSLSISSSSAPVKTSSNSFGGKKGPKRLIGSLGLGINGGSFNWEIPPFPVESKTESKVEDEIEVKLLSNRSSQIEDRDWALLEVEQNGFNVDLGAEVGSGLSKPFPGTDWADDVAILMADEGVVFSKEYFRSRSDLKIDRGTSCEGFAGQFGYSEKVTKLSNDFPLADSTHIEEVLNACHGDYQWAFNLLSQFNEQHFDTISNQINAINFDENIQESSQEPSPSSSPSAEELNCQNEPFDIASQLGLGDLNQQSTQYSFYLDPAFAVELQSSFGQVLKEGEIDEKYLRVDCSSEVARLIHYLWVNAYNSQSKDKPTFNQNTGYVNPFSLSTMIKPSVPKVINTSKKESKAWSNKDQVQAPIQPKSAFQEIMDLEMAISLSRKEYNSSNPNQAASKHSISTKLKRDALKSSFPGLDEKALEELFEANVYKIKETIECVEHTLGIQITITPEVDALIKEESGISNDHGEASFFTRVTRSSSPSSSLSAGDVIRQLRGEIQQCAEKKRELSEKGNTAFRAKMYAVASYYKAQSQEYDRKISDLRSQIIDAVVRANPSNSLDLHGVHSNEVLTTLGSYLANKHDEVERRRLNKLRLLIITGRGAHSLNGPRLKPLVINYLKQKRYRYEIINPGVISVTIP